MKKLLSIMLVLTILACGTFFLTGCGSEENSNQEGVAVKPENSETKVVESDEVNVSDMKVGEVKITKDDDSIYMITKKADYVEKFEYKYENGVFSKLFAIVIFESEALAKTAYDEEVKNMENSEDQNKMKFELKGNQIIGEYNATSQELEGLKEFKFDDLYNTLKSAEKTID